MKINNKNILIYLSQLQLLIGNAIFMENLSFDIRSFSKTFLKVQRSKCVI